MSFDATTFETPMRPCTKMRSLLSALADGSLSGIARWYTEHHVGYCEHCAEALATLRVLRDRLRALGVPPPDAYISVERRVTIEIALDAVDARLAQEMGGLADSGENSEPSAEL